MCCRWPPFTTSALRIYLIATFITGLFFCLLEALLLIGPADIEIISIRDCPGFIQSGLILNLDEFKQDKQQYIKGNITISFQFDEDVKITLKGISSSDDRIVSEKTYINHKSLCRIMDNYLHERSPDNSVNTLCPIPPGTYEITEESPSFSRVNLPYEMLGHKIFRLELTKHGEPLACKIFQLECTADNIGYI